jgi:uncharacterized protein
MTALDMLEKIKSCMSSDIDVHRVILFGSRARGDNSEQSDFDVCVIVSNSADKRSVYVRSMRDLANTEWSIDLLVLTEADYIRKLDEGWTVLKTVEQEGQLLYVA